jgi:hypothetical protein
MPVTIQPSSTTGTYLPGTGDKGALFACGITWIIAGATSGYVVQRVQRNEKYGARVRGGDTNIVTAGDYWEAWQIDGMGKAQPTSQGINDNFGVYNKNTLHHKGRSVLRPDKDGTRGKWKIRGTVYYVADRDFDAAHWYRAMDPITGAFRNDGLSVPMAGKLLSRYDPPVPGDGLNRGATLGRVVCVRQFAGTWDWTGNTPVSTRRSWPMGGNFDSVTAGDA